MNRRVLWPAFGLTLIVALAACGGGPLGGGATDDAPAENTAENTAGTPESWRATAASHRSEEGEELEYECSPDGVAANVWGTDVYTDDSSVCTAAVHAGLITLESGGTVTIEIRPGEDSYDGSERNGVTSIDYGSWGGSFVFPEAE